MTFFLDQGTVQQYVLQVTSTEQEQLGDLQQSLLYPTFADAKCAVLRPDPIQKCPALNTPYIQPHLGISAVKYKRPHETAALHKLPLKNILPATR